MISSKRLKSNFKQRIIQVLKDSKVKRASFFGSILRQDFSENSDIDIIVEYSTKQSLIDHIRLKNNLQDLLQRNVDLITYKSLHPRMKDKIFNNMEEIFNE